MLQESCSWRRAWSINHYYVIICYLVPLSRYSAEKSQTNHPTVFWVLDQGDFLRIFSSNCLVKRWDIATFQWKLRDPSFNNFVAIHHSRYRWQTDIQTSDDRRRIMMIIELALQLPRSGKMIVDSSFCDIGHSSSFPRTRPATKLLTGESEWRRSPFQLSVPAWL